ncbi:MAG TPA: hypothetical protein VFD24_04090 [Chitinophagaceae bacterium]|jgi:hypothetical protein|nr:hypothetical protein [Chitinophagaceae bacterium]
MFDEVLKMVKDHLGNNQEISSLPADQQDAVHHEVATQMTNELKNQASTQGGAGGLLSMLQNSLTSGNPVVHAIEGGLVGGLLGKFGLSPTIAGAVTAALPGLLQKFVHKANDPNDPSITKESIDQSLATATANTNTGAIPNLGGAVSSILGKG